MADEAISIKGKEVIARDLGIKSFMKGIHTVKAALTTMKPGMIVTTFGETGRDIDIFVDGDEYATGIVLGLRKRKYGSDGAIDGGAIDTAFAAADEVVVLYFGHHVAYVYMWITAMDAAKGAGALRKGAPVYVQHISDITALASANITLGSAMALLKGALDLSAGFTQPLMQIGILQEDVTVQTATALGGKVVKVLV